MIRSIFNMRLRQLAHTIMDLSLGLETQSNVSKTAIAAAAQ